MKKSLVALNDFVGRRVIFGVSDPWDFGPEDGAGLWTASVKAASHDALLLKLTEPINYKGTSCDHLVATARHADKRLSQMSKIETIPVNLTPIPTNSVTEDKPEAFFHAAAAWRAWHLIGGLGITD